jgi:hypothetical protein
MIFEMNIGEVWEMNDGFYPIYDTSRIPPTVKSDFKILEEGTVFTVIGKLDVTRSNDKQFKCIEYKILFDNKIAFLIIQHTIKNLKTISISKQISKQLKRLV